MKRSAFEPAPELRTHEIRMTLHFEAAPAHTSHAIGMDALRVSSISHHTASLAELERTALTATGRSELCRRLHQAGIESVALSTCNRTELYWCSRGPTDDARVEALLLQQGSEGPPLRADAFAREAGSAAAAHLFRVAAGLESLVVGEAEVLGQVRDSIEQGEAEGTAGIFLSGLFRAALRFGGRARADTRIGVGALSVASASVQLLTRVHEDLSARTVLVIGAGPTGLKAARHLRAERVGRLVLLNRTEQRARDAAGELGAEAAALDALPFYLPQADAVVAAVQAESPMVTAERVRAAVAQGRTRTLALIDLSLPRAIDPACASIPGVVLHDLSGLEQIVSHNRARREREIPRVEALLVHELEVFEAQARESAVRPLVAELRQRAENIRCEEMERALRDGPVDEDVLERVTRRVVDRLMHAPSQALRRGDLALDPQHVRYLRFLFDLEGGQEHPHLAGHAGAVNPHAGASPHHGFPAHTTGDPTGARPSDD